MNPKISVIIRCFNEEKHIGKLLVGLSKQKLRDHEIIIVDSGSTDDTLQIASRFGCQILEIKPEEFSFGRALNRGCEVASGDFLVFASAHVYPVYDDWLACLIEPMKRAEIAAVYGKQRGNKQSRFSEKQIFLSWYPEKSISVSDTPFCNNANCAIRRTLWKDQRYDESITGLEDLEWAHRVSKEGWKVSYSAEAEIVHVHEETAHQIFNRYRREAIALKKIFSEQRMSFFSFLKLAFINSANDYVQAMRERIFLKNILDIPIFRFLQFWGAYRGLNQTASVTNELKKTFYYPRLARSEHSGHERNLRERIQYEKLI